MRKALLSIGILVGIVVVALLAVPLWIGPVVTGVANAIAPGRLKVGFNLGKFALNPYTGHLGVGLLKVDNPSGYADPTALSLADLSVDVDVGSLFGDAVVVNEILVKDVYTTYLKNGEGKYNVDVILESVQGEEKTENAPSLQNEKPKDSGRRVIIDHVRVEGVKVKWGVLTIPVPTLDITGIGRSSGGVDWDTAWADIRAKVLEACGAAGANLQDLGLNLKELGVDTGKLATQLGAQGVDRLGGAAKAVKLDAGVGAAKETLKDAGNALKGAGGALKGLFK